MEIGVPVKAKNAAFFRMLLICPASVPYWVLCPSSMKAMTFFLVRIVSLSWDSFSRAFWSCVNSSGLNFCMSVMRIPRLPLPWSCFSVFFSVFMVLMISGFVMSRAVNSVYSCSWSSSRSTMKNIVGFSSVGVWYSLFAAKIMVRVLPEPCQCQIKPLFLGVFPCMWFTIRFVICSAARYCM